MNAVNDEKIEELLEEMIATGVLRPEAVPVVVEVIGRRVADKLVGFELVVVVLKVVAIVVELPDERSIIDFTSELEGRDKEVEKASSEISVVAMPLED